MNVQFANAPTSWGIETPGDPSYPKWQKVLDECGGAGYSGIELGPYGFLPTEPDVLRAELHRRGLSLVGGVLMEPFHDSDSRSKIIKKADALIQLLVSQNAPFVIFIAGFTDERVMVAGNSEMANRLGSTEFSVFCETLRILLERAEDAGIRGTIHPHAGTHIEFIDEIHALADRVAVDFCVDIGHSVYGGIDVEQLLLDLGERVKYVHCKDVRTDILEDVIRSGGGFWNAHARGVFTVLGKGAVDYPRIMRTLAKLNYEGWITVEQDAQPSQGTLAFEHAKLSLEFLKALLVGR